MSETQTLSASAPAQEQAYRVPTTTVIDNTTVPQTYEIHHAPIKRDKTWGEHTFNVATYGGFATLGNEGLSILIMNSAEKGWLRKIYEPFKKIFTDLKGSSFLPRYVTEGRLPYLLFATIGGMFTVFPIKYFEDRKGNMVRKLDHFFHGNKIYQDPYYIEAHKEMDEAPKQTWSSLGKGRVVTVIAAAVADAVFGWKEAITTKIIEHTPLKDTWVKKYSSLHNLSTTVADKLVDDVFKVPVQKRSMVHEWAVTGGWLLTLSTTLTVLFYASSKLFARKSEEKRERKLEEKLGIPAHIIVQRDETEQFVQTASTPNQPSLHITQIAHEGQAATHTYQTTNLSA